VTFGTAVAKIKPLNFWKTPLRIDIMVATDLIIGQLLPRFQEHSSMDAVDLAEIGRITKYMLSFFPVKRVVFGKGEFYLNKMATGY
jgi:hypothetical protein